jgi:hypothetical protein
MQFDLNWIILDAARLLLDLDLAKKYESRFLNLYKGDTAESLKAVAPYLFNYDRGSEFENWILDKGWGQSWGVLIAAPLLLDDLQLHFRKYLIVRTEDKQQLYFRFYDPRVLKAFLPTCSRDQIIEFFGPVKYFVVEGNDKNEAIKLWQDDGVLKQSKYTTFNFSTGFV